MFSLLLKIRLQLLPRRFRRHFAEPSFDIKDLDKVDDTVIGIID